MTGNKQNRQSSPRSPWLTVIIVAALAVIAYVLWQSGALLSDDVSAPAPAVNEQNAPAESIGETEKAEPEQSASGDGMLYEQVSDLPPIAYDELPLQAHDTIALIETNGPFPYEKDGSTFQNREGILPIKPVGYYAEYTVDTPGSDDRGARRIVGGEDGEMYYTDDHYASFQEIIP